MHKLLLLFSLLIAFLRGHAQDRMQIGGNVRDTNATNALPNAVIIAVKLSDSVLVDFTRSNTDGLFQLKALPLDTYQVIISHPKYADALYIVTGSKENNVFDFGKITLPPKTQQLNEVTVLGFRDPIYYKGDTLIYTADSFKVKPNATVEDLLKKLPGMRVDAQGKITTQGKTVDKVLVDGDEFFGSDPTMATRNLNATNIESVQVYDKKNENTGDGGSDAETIKVLNLKLKEDAKKGYFGKVSGASDFQKFYEGEFLANRFNKQRKISLFGMAGNTPKTNFNFEDVFKYGLDNEMERSMSDDGNNSYYYRMNGADGIPQTLKTGVYYNEKINKKTKLLANYSYNQSQVKTTSETREQYFLTDTAYTTTNISSDTKLSKGHSLNLGFNYALDSLTTLDINPKISYSTGKQTHGENNVFISEEELVTRQTDISNLSNSTTYSIGANNNIRKNFKKKDRTFFVSYNFTYTRSENDGLLKTENKIDSNLFSSNVDQKKKSGILNYSNNVSLSYTEPITKKIKLEFLFDYLNNGGSQNKEAFNYVNSEYSERDSIFSNNFRNSRNTIRPGFKFIRETKKLRFVTGTRVRQVLVNNTNLITNNTIEQNVLSVLPFLTYRYKFTDNKSLNLSYFTGSSLPSIGQLQPVPNNNNPNFISSGNPDLLPSYDHHVESYFYSFKPISGLNLWSGISADFNNNAFGNSTTYDEFGRTVSKTVNVNGNYNSRAWFGMGIPFFKKVLLLSPELNADYDNTISFINEKKNITTTASLSSSMELEVNTDKITLTLGASYEYNVPKSTLSNETNKPYATEQYGLEVEWQLPKKFVMMQDLTYTLNRNRTYGYNINYFIWNASFGKKFLKNENMILSVQGNDILNQNINASRTVNSNVITDTKTNIIKRYFLLQLMYKFNSTKTKEEEDDMF
ncbi:MAG: outer membrane beta-barrel protein [Bacteroidota bacterium]|nr:outer membrane beta-barrel protein [Bacteroidota bacterium]